MTEEIPVDFRTEPSRYRHWRLRVDGRVATLAMDVREDGGLPHGWENLGTRKARVLWVILG
jgi:hypothetical protein